jgi:hypothetical protein
LGILRAHTAQAHEQSDRKQLHDTMIAWKT